MIENLVEELKKCPFCGGEAEFSIDPEPVIDTKGRKWAYQVACRSCCVATGICWSLEMAREAWNRRAEE